MTKLSYTHIIATTAVALLIGPYTAHAQQPLMQSLASATQPAPAAQAQSNVPDKAQNAQEDVERVVRRFRIGVEGGVGLDPELIEFGAHGAFGPIFHRNIEFRPGIEFGVGEVTTAFGINLDVLYTLPGATRQTRWTPYVGAGPNFGLSHQGFESAGEEGNNRFDFSDTDFDAGFNFIAGARSRGGMFFELRATAYGVSNVKLMVGYNF